MCGIAGIISSKYKDGQMELALMQQMHRGPDGSGLYTEAPLVLGHNRLAIQDLSDNGKQPMLSCNQNFIIVYNGEIYNHQEIRDSLIVKGVNFKSQSDTETILYGYIHYGESILNRLNGIFAFAIYDKEKRSLFAARDPYGVKPFYFYNHNNQFVFSSELKTILKLSDCNKNINLNAQYQTLMLQWNIGEDTGFERIKKLAPGHLLNINIDDTSTLKIKKWSNENLTGQYLQQDEDKWVKMLDSALTDAVKRQLLSKKPISFFLSGGLDSSLLIAIAQKLEPTVKHQAFCISTGAAFGNEGFSDDVHFAKIVANHLQVDLEIIEAKSDFLDEFDEMIFQLEELQADIAPIFVGQIAKAASARGFSVMISGVGGDDIFTGYRRHQAINKENWIKKAPNLLSAAINLIVPFLPKNATKRRLKYLVQKLGLNPQERLFSYFFWANKNDVLKLFSDKALALIHQNCIEQQFEEYLKRIPANTSLLDKMLQLEINSFLPNHNLNYTDKMGMASSIEIRVPYLDLELTKLAASIPPELKLKGMTTKYLLKKVAEKYLPAEVIYRSKTGFGAPIRNWLQTDKKLQEAVWKRISSPIFSNNDLYNHKEITALFQDTIHNKKDGAYTILGLLAIESWTRQFASIS